jgi:hypothetical protein
MGNVSDKGVGAEKNYQQAKAVFQRKNHLTVLTQPESDPVLLPQTPTYQAISTTLLQSKNNHSGACSDAGRR